MKARKVAIILMITAFAVGCRDAEHHLKLRRMTTDLLRSISDFDKQLASEEDSLRYLDLLGKSPVMQAAVIENSKKRVLSLRAEIQVHSDFENPSVDQIRFEELDHQKLLDRFKKISAEHAKGMKRAKE